MSSTALPLAALFPGIDLKVFAIAAGLLGLALVWLDRYQLIETLMMILIGIMFFHRTALGIPDTAKSWRDTHRPDPPPPHRRRWDVLRTRHGRRRRRHHHPCCLWILAARKGWNKPKWLRVMRVDNATAYILTGIFVFATMIMGVELLHSAGLAISAGDQGLLDISEVLADRYGEVWSVVFLIGFFAASFSSLLGVWHGVSLMFADFWTNFRRPADELDQDDAPTLKSMPARFYMLMLTIPTMALLFFDQPIFLILLYGTLGDLFMPFLAVTLLFLNNQKRFVPEQFRNKWFHNVFLAITAGVFVAIGANELYEALSPLWSGG